MVWVIAVSATSPRRRKGTGMRRALSSMPPPKEVSGAMGHLPSHQQYCSCRWCSESTRHWECRARRPIRWHSQKRRANRQGASRGSARAGQLAWIADARTAVLSVWDRITFLGALGSAVFLPRARRIVATVVATRRTRGCLERHRAAVPCDLQGFSPAAASRRHFGGSATSRFSRPIPPQLGASRYRRPRPCRSAN